MIAGIGFENQMGVGSVDGGLVDDPVKSERVSRLQMIACDLLVLSGLPQVVELGNVVKAVFTFGVGLGRDRILGTGRSARIAESLHPKTAPQRIKPHRGRYRAIGLCSPLAH